MTNNRSVIIVGGGASGALLATQLLRRLPSVTVSVIEPRGRLGTGMAYSTDCPSHMLNVPAGKMSAFPDDPGHFTRWLATNGLEKHDATSFVPRPVYGDYLTSIVAAARAEAGIRFHHIRDVACAAHVDAEGVRVQLGCAQSLRGDLLVLALGNAAPAAWPHISGDVLSSEQFYPSAWDARALVPGVPNEVVLLLGTGLTAVDAVLGLRHNGHRGTIYMVSRRGLLPHEHRVFDTPPQEAPDAKTVRDLIGAVRTRTRSGHPESDNWRIAVDSVRPKTNAIWQGLSVTEKRRFLRHVMPYWNVHRHRMAPQVAKDLSALIAAGSLRMLAGRTEQTVRTGRAFRVPIRLRGGAETILIEAARIINCSGPEHDFRKLPNPLVQSLLAEGQIVPNPLQVGVMVGPNGALIDRTGATSSRLFAIGPVRYGTLIETTAIPEIRQQASDLAALLAELELSPVRTGDQATRVG